MLDVVLTFSPIISISESSFLVSKETVNVGALIDSFTLTLEVFIVSEFDVVVYLGIELVRFMGTPKVSGSSGTDVGFLTGACVVIVAAELYD